MTIKLLILFAIIGTGCAQQVVINGGASASGGVVINAPPVGPITGGQVTIPLTVANAPQTTLFVRQGIAYLSYDGPTTDPNAGMWYANAAACEASPSTCTWTAANHAGQNIVAGVIRPVREIAPNSPDATHELLIADYNGNSGQCTTANGNNCIIQLYDTVAMTYSNITLPSMPTGQAPGCLARDSTGIYYTFSHYQGHIWHSPDATGGGTWVLISANFTTLPGLTSPASGGNIYTCKVYGARVYFGGEGGVMSCLLDFSSCSQDFLPFSSPANVGNNFTFQLADVEDGSASNPTMMLQCCRADHNIANYTQLARYSGGTWTQLISTTSGIPQFTLSNFFETNNQTTGTGTARLYYFRANGIPASAFVSTSSTGTNFVSYSPALWPAVGSTYSLLQISTNQASGAKWSVFEGTSSPIGVYITP